MSRPAHSTLSFGKRYGYFSSDDTTIHPIHHHHRSARLSILYSIIRLDPYPGRRRRLHCTAALFVLFWALLMGQQFWVCQHEPGWRNQLVPQCRFDKQIALSQLTCSYAYSSHCSSNHLPVTYAYTYIADVISDSILLAAPWTLWWGFSDQVLRRRLIIIFSTCVITTIVSIVHAALIITNGGEVVIIAGLVEVSSLLLQHSFKLNHRIPFEELRFPNRLQPPRSGRSLLPEARQLR
jgi:hypothetical protein